MALTLLGLGEDRGDLVDFRQQGVRSGRIGAALAAARARQRAEVGRHSAAIWFGALIAVIMLRVMNQPLSAVCR